MVKRVREVILDYAAFSDMRESLKVQSEPKLETNWRWWVTGAVVQDAQKQDQAENNTDTDRDRVTGLQTGSRRDIGENSRAQDVSLANKYLRKIYILTNGEPVWLDEMKHALLQNVVKGWGDLEWEWEGIATSRDLHLGWEKPISQAQDMYIAQRAEVFIGNGVSRSIPFDLSFLLRQSSELDVCALLIRFIVF